MNYKYHVILGEQFIIMRWPFDQPYDDDFIEAVCDHSNKYDFTLDVAVVGDLVLTDAPMFGIKNSTYLLDEGFNGEPDSLPQFDLWDYKNGKFVTIKGRRKEKCHRLAN